MEGNGNGSGTALAARPEERQMVSPFEGAQQFAVEQRRALALANSTVVPQAYRGNVSNVLVAMEYASRIGVSVLAVMQNLNLIQGKPGLSASFLIGTVNASKRFTPLRFRWVGTKGQADWGCYAVAKDLDSGEECEGALIDWQMVKAEGWLDKSGSKWKTMPQQMFMYRAAAFWTRVYCPEISLGLHTTEELHDLAGPLGDDRVRNVSAALDAGDQPQTLEAEVINETTGEVTAPAESGDLELTQVASALAIDQLRAKIETAREKDLLQMEDEEALAAALQSQDASQVRLWIETLDGRIANAPKKARARA